MQLTIISKHFHQFKVIDFANASYQGTELTIFAKFQSEFLELGLDDVQPTNTKVYRKHNLSMDEGYFSYIIIEHLLGQVYRWTMISRNDFWKSGVFGSGLPPITFGFIVPFSELPKRCRAKFITDKLNEQ